MNRKDFISTISLFSMGTCMPSLAAGSLFSHESAFAKHLQPVGRALEMEGYYIWCNSPIEDDNGKLHVFFSRWIAKKGNGRMDKRKRDCACCQ